MKPSTRNDERIDCRLPKETKEVIGRAASLTGQSITDFVVSSAYRGALTVLEGHQATILSARDWAVFLAALSAQEEPNPTLRAAAIRYKASLPS